MVAMTYIAPQAPTPVGADEAPRGLGHTRTYCVVALAAARLASWPLEPKVVAPW